MNIKVNKRKLGRRLAELRREHGMTQKQVAAKLGMVLSNYSKIELGNYGPTFENFLKLVELYQVKADDLLRDFVPLGILFRYREISARLRRLPEKESIAAKRFMRSLDQAFGEEGER